MKGARLARMRHMRAFPFALSMVVLSASCGGVATHPVNDGGTCTSSSLSGVYGTETGSYPSFTYLTWSCGPTEYVAECDCTYYFLAEAGNDRFQPQILTCSVDGAVQRTGSGSCCVSQEPSTWAALCGFPSPNQ